EKDEVRVKETKGDRGERTEEKGDRDKEEGGDSQKENGKKKKGRPLDLEQFRPALR
uniref:Uncharacterized protein n=1 Tax=Amphimedon queenslandica TaxID=400682 RepID=A0A1X7VH14_AMPQE